MGNIQSRAIGRRSAAGGLLGFLGALAMAISVGPLFWLLNGGYSIVGMAWLAEHAGEYGRLFWAVATYLTINVPIAQRAGLPLAQPIIPWVMVGGISFLQISMMVRKLRRDRSEPWMDAASYAVSIFDFATTAIGVMFAPFVAAAVLAIRILWAILALGLAVPLTFGFEAMIARVLRGRRYVRPDNTDRVGDRTRREPDRVRDRRGDLPLDDDDSRGAR